MPAAAAARTEATPAEASTTDATEVRSAAAHGPASSTEFVPAGREIVPSAPTVEGRAELGIFTDSRPEEAVVSLSPELHLGIRPRPEVELHATFGAVSVFRLGPAGYEQQTRPSNLGFGANGVLDRRGARWRFAKVGFSFVLPSAYAKDALEESAYEYALAGRMSWDPWRWVPGTFGLVVPAEVRAQVGRRWILGGDAGLAALLPSATRTDGLSGAAQISGLVRLLGRRFGWGMRLNAVWNGRHPVDRSQAGLSPFVDTSLCRRTVGRRLKAERSQSSHDCPVYATARLNINLDGPYGFYGEDPMGVWGVQVGLGWAVY